MKEIVIAFGSESGTAGDLALEVQKHLQDQNMPTKFFDLDDFTLNDLQAADYFLLVTSTHGDGEPPYNAERFYGDLMEASVSLSQLSFSVCALGDRTYDQFCQCGKDFDQRLEALGGKRFVARTDCDVDFDEPFDAWLEQVTQKLKEINK